MRPPPDGALNSDILIDFLRRLLKDAGSNVYLVLDNLRVHHSKPVKAWLAERKHEIEVFYLPSYSPEPNPNDIADADLKQAVTKLAPAARSCSWSRPRPSTCTAFNASLNASRATSNTNSFAMRPDSSLFMPIR